MRWMLLPLAALAQTACASVASPPPPVTVSTAPIALAVAPAGDPFAVTGPLRDEALPLLKGSLVDPKTAQLPALPPGVPAAAAACDAFVSRKAAGALRCGGLASLDTAYAEASTDRRDALLLDLEGCPELPAGVVRALRAELAPTECADALVAGFLASAPAALGGPAYVALLGQATAARLARLPTAAPVLGPPFSRPRVKEFLQGPIALWVGQSLPAMETMSRGAAGLTSYGKGLAAVEAGMAELRIVEAVRGAPIPDEMQADPGVRSEYYAALDQSLDPRKDRGRDAALVGLRELATAGVLHDARVERVRALLAKHYGGRRIDALDALLLAPLPAAQPASAEERLAGLLPTYYAGLLLDEQAATRPGTLRRLLDRGVPLPQRSALKVATLSPEVRGLYARARLDLGRTYWRAVDFDQAVALASDWPAGAKRPDDVTLVLAVALALRGGPEDAAELVRKAPLGSVGLGQVGALDALAGATPPGPYAGLAAFDAALVKEIATPQGAGAAYFQELAARFTAAAGRLTDPKQQATATAHAQAATATAAAIH